MSYGFKRMKTGLFPNWFGINWRKLSFLMEASLTEGNLMS